MAAPKRLVLVSVLLGGAAVSACTSTGNDASTSLAASSAGYPLLPEAILTIPNAPGETEGGGSIAEASVVQAAPQPEAGQSVSVAGDVVPAKTDGRDATPVQTAALGVGEESATITPAAFAGSTPTQALASAAMTSAEAAEVQSILAPETRLGPEDVAARSPELDLLIAKYAKHYEVPEELVRHVAKRESTLNPRARNGPYWGLMQISHPTARGMGYRGAASGLLDAETNLKYAVRYLRGAWLVAKGDMALADMFYRRGYYYDAKRAGLLDETGLGEDRRRRRGPSL